MHILFSLQFWHYNIFLALATICMILDIRYPVQKYPPTPHTLKKLTVAKTPNLDGKMWSSANKRTFLQMWVNSLFLSKLLGLSETLSLQVYNSVSYWVLLDVLDHPAATAGRPTSAVFLLCQGWGWLHCRGQIAAGWCPVPLEPVPSPTSSLSSPHSWFLHYFCRCLLAASRPATEEEEAKTDKTVFLLAFSLAMQTSVAAKNSSHKEIPALDL